MPISLSDFVLPRDPDVALEAVTKQYVDNKIQPTADGIWRWRSDVLSGVPASGLAGVNTDTPISATILYIHKTTDVDNIDMTNILAPLREGDTIYIQAKNDATSWLRYDVTGTSTLSGNGYVIPVIVQPGAAEGNEPASNVQVYFRFGLSGGAGSGGGLDEVAIQSSEPAAHPDLWVDLDDDSGTSGGGGGGVGMANVFLLMGA